MSKTSDGHYSQTPRSDLTRPPRLLSRSDAAAYCGVSRQTFSHWVTIGILPPALPRTARWDARAIDSRLDAPSGLELQNNLSELIDGGQNVRVVLKGIHKIKKRLANGEIKMHYYAWRGGPPIHEKPTTPEFVQAYHEAHSKIRKPKVGTMMTILADFKSSSEFTGLRPSTQKSYRNYIKLIENEFGDLPVAALSDRRIRGEFKTWRDSFAATPRKADYAWTTLARVLSFARDRSVIAKNPCERGGRLYVAN